MNSSLKVEKALKEMGLRIESLRIRKTIQQKEICNAASVSPATYSRLVGDDGGSVGVGKLFSVLEELGVLDAVVAAIPEEQVSPLQFIQNKKNKPARIRKSGAASKRERKETW
jgi:transcriptional regulator with XRE-family HTH domain